MAINHKNFAQTTLAAAITDTSGTSITVTSETSFPAVNFIISIDTEVMLVTNVSTTTWTVTRGYEGSTAATHLNGATIYHDISAAEADSIAAKLPLSGGTMTGDITLGENVGIALDPAGSADEKWSGVTIAGTAGATLAVGDLCYLDVTAAEWLLADADAAATAGSVVLGICLTAANDGQATKMLLMGTVRSAAFPASIALGAPLYVSTDAGDITATQPSGADDVIRVVGWAVTVEPNTIYFCPSADFFTHT